MNHDRLFVLLTLKQRLVYKDEYEKFKLYLTVLLLLLSFLCYFFVTYRSVSPTSSGRIIGVAAGDCMCPNAAPYVVGFRFLDAILNFLLLWFYCTLTVRESVLISNGSRSVTSS